MLNITHYQRNANQTTIRYHLMSVRMAAIQNSTNNKCWRGCGEKGALLDCWWGCKWIQPLWRTVWRCHKIPRIKLHCDPAIPLLGKYSEKTIIEKDTCTPVFTATLFTIARTWKQPRCQSTDKWIKKLWYVYTKEYSTAIKSMHVYMWYIYTMEYSAAIKSQF